MGRNKKDSPAPRFEAGFHLLLWCALFAALALVPDQKILRYKILALEAGVWTLLAASAASWAFSAKAALTRTPLDWAVLLYASGGLLFYLLSPERGVSRLELNRIIFSAAAFFAAAQSWPKVKNPRAPLAVFVYAAAALALYALLQLRGGIWIIEAPQLERPIATFGNPIFLAAYFAAALAVALCLSLSARTQGARLAHAAAAALLAAGLWATQSRAAVAGLGLAACAAAALFLRAGARRAFLACAAAAAALALWHFRARQWTHGLIWKDTLALWAAHPIFGCGLGRFHVEFPAYASEALKALWPQQKVIINFAHSEYLQVLAETGIVGFGIFLAVPAAAFRWAAGALRHAEDRGLLAGLALAAAALFAQAFFSPDMRFGVSSFIVFAFLGAACALSRGESRSPPPFPGRYGMAALLAAFLAAWGSLAAQPILAQRRLEREPAFHVEHSPELQKLFDRLEEQVRSDPNNGDLAENLAYLYAKERRWDKAVEKYELAERLLPGRPGPGNNLGNIYYSLGRREDAIACWKRSLQAAPGQLDAHINLGKALYEVGRLKESAKHLQAVLKRDPNNEKAQILLKKMIE
ncbi:MAG: tetratricopeptide repeat protein [Elusimicrobia bacterium]|nr:tetratricopeptide repeat protein [Elusimicrobiota bacterium]